MLLSGSDTKDLLNVMYHWNKVRMAHCQVIKSVQWIRAWMKLTVIAVGESTFI